MTRAQESYLSVAKDADVPRLMQEYGFEFVGPTDNHSFLFKTLDGRAWLMSDFRGKVAPMRLIQPSAWTEVNLDYFERHSAIGA